MRVHGAGHGNGALHIAEAVVGFVLNGLAGLSRGHPRFKAATLNHEVADDTVENQPVIETVANVLFEVFGSLGGLVVIQFQSDVTVGGFQQNHQGFLFK